MRHPEEHNKLAVDPDTSWIIEKHGTGAGKITKILIQEKIPTSGYINYKKYGQFAKFYENALAEKAYAWNIRAVSDILKDETYIGNSVHGKQTNVSYKNKKSIRKPESEWFKVENTHEAIISKDVFNQVQKQIASRRRPMKSGKTQVFAGLVKCADCGWSLSYAERAYFDKTHGDFFKDEKHFGGMWDYLGVNDEGEVDTVLEMKTTKRAEDWGEDIPEYYALQAALYAYLLGVDNVIMVASFLSDKDYDDPAKFKPNVENTITVEFKVSERYPDFADKIAAVEKWWKDYVETGVSPDYDEKRDAEILTVLRTNTLSPETDMKEVIAEAEHLKEIIDRAYLSIEETEARYEHSKNVANALEKLTDDLGLEWERRDSPYIIGLLHDVCKVDQYVTTGYLTENMPRYDFNPDTLYKGHGEKSVLLLTPHISLTEEEVACITYHMGAFTNSSEWDNYTGAIHRYPNVLYTHTADMIAAHIKEVTK